MIDPPEPQQIVEHLKPPEYPLSTYLYVFWLSSWGGAVAYLQKSKTRQFQDFSWLSFIVELFSCAFVGLLTFWTFEWRGFGPVPTAIAVALSGHLGTRALFLLRNKWFSDRV